MASITGASATSPNPMFGWFEIDHSPCRASYGMKNAFAWTLEISAAARRQAMNYIAKTAQQGDRKADIASKENVIAEIAAENSHPQEAGELVIVPIERPVIKYHPSARFAVDI